jgi:hypothetical protein
MDEPEGAKTQKALRWVASELALRPDARRRQLLQEAALRFDLDPMETELLLRLDAPTDEEPGVPGG